MDKTGCFKILEIEETKDEETIKAAYRRLLSNVNPEEDQVGFMRLREAYEKALSLINDDGPDEEAKEDPYEELKDGSETDVFIYETNLLYNDFSRRIDPEEWKKHLDNDICDSIDMEMEISDRLLFYISSHHYMPMEVWSIINDKFDYLSRIEDLKEKFPPDFLSYVAYKITHEEFIDFKLISAGDLRGRKIDEFIDSYLGVKYGNDQYVSELLHIQAQEKMDEDEKINEDPEEQKKRIESIIRDIEENLEKTDSFDIDYPFADCERMRYYSISGKNREKALEYAEDLLFQYPDILYICASCAQVLYECGKRDEAKEAAENVLNEKKDFYQAKLTLSHILFEEGDLENAKEYCLDLIDSDDRNVTLRQFLDEINDKLIKEYEDKVKNEPYDFEILNKLCWCYFQDGDFEKTEETLKTVKEEDREKYDFINLRGRNFLAMDDYDNALTYLPVWLDRIDNEETDDPDERKKRDSRRGFAYFSIGYCKWKLGDPETAESYFLKAIEFEESESAIHSYKDQLMDLYCEIGKRKEAYEIADKIISEDHTYYPAYLKRLKMAFEDKDGQKVIDDYYECIKLYPYYAEPYVCAFKVFYYARQYEEAERVYNRAEEAGIKSDELLLFRYKLRRIRERENSKLVSLRDELTSFVKEAEERFDKKTDSDLKDATELYLELSLLNWELEDTDEALRLIDVSDNKYGSDRGMTTLRADILYDKKDYENAAKEYKKAISFDDPYPDLYLKHGKCFELLGDIDQALTEYLTVYEMDPDHDEINFRLMRAYKKLFEKDKSRKDCFEKALKHINVQIDMEETDADKAYYLIERGILNEAADNLESAYFDYMEAAELKPDNIYAHNNAGLTCIRLRRFDEGENAFNQALKCANESHDVWTYGGYADLMESKGDIEKAIELTLKELEFHPDSFYLNDDLARRYMRLKKFEDARMIYARMFDKKLMVSYKYNIKVAESYFEEGNIKKASSHYKTAYGLVSGIIKEAGSAYDARQFVCSCIGDFYYRIMKDSKSEKYYRDGMDVARLVKDEYSVAMRAYDIAQLYYESGRKAKAVPYARKFLDYMINKHGSLMEAANILMGHKKSRSFKIAYALLMTDNLEGAKKMINQVVSSLPCRDCYDCPDRLCHECYLLQGLIYEAEGNLSSALDYCERGIKVALPIPCHDLERLKKRINEKKDRIK